MVPKHRVNKIGLKVKCIMLKRCISLLTMTTTLKKLETYYPMHCFPPKYTHNTLRRPNISEFSSAPQKAEWQKNKSLVEKTKGSDSYAISSAKFTTEAIATPAVLDTCTVGTMEHEKHPLTIYCSVQADTRT